MNKASITIMVFILLFFAVWFFADLQKKGSTPELSPSPSSDLQLNLNQKQAQTPVATPIPKPSTISTKLEIEDLKEGQGDEVKSGDTIEVNYVGTLENGQKFDSSYDRNQTFTTEIGTGQVIKGWDMGLLGMKVGGKRRLTIPPSLGYGARATGSIPANSTLIFEIELVNIKSK